VKTASIVGRQRQVRWRTMTISALAVAGLFATACTGSSTGSKGSTGSTSAVKSGSTTATPVSGGTVTESVPGLASLDPQGVDAQDPGTGTVAKAVFSRLVTLGTDNSFQPQLATKWTTSADGLTWTFNLNPAAKFSDGTPVTANDVKASIQRVVDLKGVNASLFTPISSVTATDPNTVTMTTKAPLATMLQSLTLLYIGPADRINQAGFWNKPIGSGPFVVSSFAARNKAVLTRNPNYWGSPAHLDKVVLTVVPEVAGQITALQTGAVDIVSELPEDQATTVSGMDNATVVSSKPGAILTIWFNNKKAPFTDERVRQAMWYAVDWETLRKSLYGPTAAQALAPIASAVFGYAAQQPYTFDPAKAKQLLAAAGMPNGFSTSIKYVPANVPQLQSLLQGAATDWAKVGIKVTLLPEQSAVWSKDLKALNWDMTALENTSRTGDADQILGRLYTSSADRLGFADSQYDQLVKDAASTVDQSKRQADYAQAEQILWSKAVGIWPLEIAATYGVNKRVTGFVPDPSSVVDFSSVGVSGS
jgi:peptide/nickel transport system substrate-binding protein